MDGLMKIGELAKQTGLSIRTLHYYDEIGLLVPSHRTESEHRLYGEQDIIRLQQILSLRQLGLSLREIRQCLERPDYSLPQVINLHRDRTVARLGARSAPAADIDYPDPLPLAPRAKRVLELAHEEAEQAGQTQVAPEHLLLGILGEDFETPERYCGVAVWVLKADFGLDLRQLEQQVRSVV